MSIDTDHGTDQGRPAVVDLSTCEQEPIHTPGLIQPHGILLVLEKGSLRIVQASANTLELVGRSASEVLGQPLPVLIGAEQGKRLEVMLRAEGLMQFHPVRMALGAEGRRFDVLVHGVDDQLVLEAETVVEGEAPNDGQFYDEFESATERLQSAESVEGMLALATQELRRITGFDRVMAYRFDQDWHGEVVAEAKRADLSSSYLGMHFPASDIPAQARRLYATNRLRMIPDATYAPVAVLAARGNAPAARLDMSQCFLRSVSPMHVEYLANMGVRATMTISLMCNGQLWGLITCHHYGVKRVSAELRRACVMLGHMLGMKLEFRAEVTTMAQQARSSRLQVQFLEVLARGTSLHALGTDAGLLPHFLRGTGAAIVDRNAVSLLGQTPEEGHIRPLLEGLLPRLEEGVFQTHCLAGVYEAAAGFAATAAGALVVEISRQRGEYLLWFRPEQVHMVSWSGNPDKPVLVENGTARLHPRKSFELWQQQVVGHCVAWTPPEVALARDLGQALANVLATEAQRSRAVAEREHALRASRDAANAANIAKSEFLANMSHEIRTPMTAILGYADLLRKEQSTTARRDYVETIKRNGDHLLAIINDILDISKIEAGKVVIEGVRVSPRQLLGEVIDLMSVKASAKGLTLQVVTAPNVPETVVTDPMRLRQILMNIIGNAIKFTEAGSVTVRVSCVRRPAALLKFEVIDTGIGISESQMGRLFHAFVQADTSTTRRFGGTGLGLRISQRLAEMLGGGIQVTSEWERGSTFTVTLATGTSDEEVVEAAPDNGVEPVGAVEEALALKGLRVLVAEDVRDSRRLIGLILSSAGATVSQVSDGKELVEMLCEGHDMNGPLLGVLPVDLIVSDMQMPVLDGYEAVRMLRGKGCRLAIVALTACAMQGDASRCILAGCDVYEKKPINEDQLIATCVRAVQGRLSTG